MLQKSRSFESAIPAASTRINPFYLNLSNIMQDEQFRTINSTYFNKWSDIEVFILYVKLYEVLELVVSVQSKDNIINIIHILMSHTESRRKLISLFQQFKNDEDSFTDIVKQYIQTHKSVLPPDALSPL